MYFPYNTILDLIYNSKSNLIICKQPFGYGYFPVIIVKDNSQNIGCCYIVNIATYFIQYNNNIAMTKNYYQIDTDDIKLIKVALEDLFKCKFDELF